LLLLLLQLFLLLPLFGLTLRLSCRSRSSCEASRWDRALCCGASLCRRSTRLGLSRLGLRRRRRERGEDLLRASLMPLGRDSTRSGVSL
jgi:hypothetical protein